MSKTCNNCGALLEDDTTFCPGCGAKYEESPAAPAKKFELPDWFSKKAMIIAGAVALGLIALIIIVSVIFTHPYKASFEAADMVDRGNFEGYVDLVPAGYWEYLEDEYYYGGKKVDAKDYIDALEDEWKENDKDYFEDYLGEDITWSYEFTRTDYMPKGLVERLAKALEEDYGIAANRVKDAARVYYDVTAKSSVYCSYGKDNYATMINIDGKWYFATWTYKYENGKDRYDELEVDFKYGISLDKLVSKKDFKDIYGGLGDLGWG